MRVSIRMLSKTVRHGLAPGKVRLELDELIVDTGVGFEAEELLVSTLCESRLSARGAETRSDRLPGLHRPCVPDTCHGTFFLIITCKECS